MTLFCVFLAFTAADIVSRDVFERLPHLEDEFAYLYQARVFAHGDIYGPNPPNATAYWQPFLITLDNQRVGKYTPGWPMLLAVGAGMMEIPWIVNAWLAMLTVAVVYRLGREVYNPAAGAAAALLTAASPAAMLLSGTYMGHTAALFFATLFMLALWKLERSRDPLLWGLVAGVSLGMMVLTRPLSAVGIAAPFVVYSVVRVIVGVIYKNPHPLPPSPPSREGEFALRWREGWNTLQPLLVLTAAAILISLLWPWFNYGVTSKPGESFPAYLVRFVRGDEDTNLYLYVWKYDKIGFGPGHGRVEHTPDRGWKHAKEDLQCSARDLFGWAPPPPDGVTVDQESRVHNSCLENSGRGYSWVLIPLGFMLGVRRRWTWLLFAVPICLVAVHITYWIGAGVYSARYYAEAITAAALLTGFGAVEIGRWVDVGIKRFTRLQTPFSAQQIAYSALIAAVSLSLIFYSPARLRPLKGYGRIGQAQIEEVNELRRNPDQPLVIIAYGDHHWRDVASIMALTDPYLQHDIILARDRHSRILDSLVEQWPDREKLYFAGGQLYHDMEAAQQAVPSG